MVKTIIAKKQFDSFNDTKLEHKLAIVGTDGNASMTGKYNGCISGLEELLNKPLYWIVCLLHTNELPLRLVFGVFDGFINSRVTFPGPIRKKMIWAYVKLDNLSVLTIVSAFFIFSYSFRAGCQRLEKRIKFMLITYVGDLYMEKLMMIWLIWR